MEEEDIYGPIRPVDRHTAEEFLSRNEALAELIKEAMDNNDQGMLPVYQELQTELLRDNPTEGRNHRSSLLLESEGIYDFQDRSKTSAASQRSGEGVRPFFPFNLASYRQRKAERRIAAERTAKRAAAPFIDANDAAVDYYSLECLRDMSNEAAAEGHRKNITLS